MGESEAADPDAATAVTRDRLFDGRLLVCQPGKGHRAGTDAVLLAAAAGPSNGGLIVDVGAGVGTAGLAAALRDAAAELVLLEKDATLADLARRNLALNGMLQRGRVVVADVGDGPARRRAGLVDGTAAVVLTNPPYFLSGTVRASPNGGRASAHVMEGASGGNGGMALEIWMQASLALLAPRGRFLMIHRPEALGVILWSARGRLGGVRVLPIHGRADEPATRILVAGIKGSRAPLSLCAGLVLHAPDGRFTQHAQAIHRGEAHLDV